MKYTEETYDELVACENYGYSKELYETLPEWKILRSLYERNYISFDPFDTIVLGNSIPRIIHQVWLGGELPQEYRRFTESWQRFHPDWKYILWLDKDAEEFPMQNREFFEASNSLGQKSDIFRYEILRKYGGLYVDTDFECLKPFDDLMYLDFFTSSGYVDKVELYIGLIACIPNHPIVTRMVDEMKGVHEGNNIWDIFKTTGSWRFTDIFFEVVNEDTDWVVAFPQKFFYPHPNNDRQCENPYKYVKPYSYATHHWAVSWVLKKK
jgi:mannosyltransferase OCH1-like enzyme